MFAIAIELLSNRYTATQFNDRNRAEWPPHPARLFSAMVAAWADSDEPDPAERNALRWLEDQSSPTIRCGDGHERRVVTHFVPVNDATALSRNVSGTYRSLSEALRTLQDAEGSGDVRQVARAQATLAKVEAKAVADAGRAGHARGNETAGVLAVLPEHRGKQGRTYPTVLPDESAIWFIWPDAKVSEEHWVALDGLLGRVARIGHSSTFVACRCTRESITPTWVPGSAGPDDDAIRLRVPRTGLLDRLEMAFAWHGGEEPRTLPAGMSYYRRARTGRRPAVRRPLLGGDWYVLGFTGKRAPSAVHALDIARAVRGAVLAHSEQPVPEILSGHRQRENGTDGPTAPLDRPHVAFVSLLNAGNRYSDGSVSGVALVLPADATAADKAVLERALVAWKSSDYRLQLTRGDRLTMTGLGVDRSRAAETWLDASISPRRRTATRDYWSGPARRWVTVTPIALDRFPGRLSSARPDERDQAEANAVEAIARACVHAGLADDPAAVTVTIRMDAPLAGLPASPSRGPQRGQRFPRYETGGGSARVCVHAEIEFPEEVRGPVLVGAGRYLGYGLCLPVGQRGDVS
jgi:CRISPR-associated protein Csb2